MVGWGSYSLTAKAAVHAFVLISDVTPQTGGRCEGTLTFVAGKLLQNLHKEIFKNLVKLEILNQ